MGAKYPLLFSCREQIVGQRYLAGIVVTQGRILAEDTGEDGEERWWLDGVAPGAAAECGPTLPDAMDAFRLAFRNVLVDLAVDAADFQAFKTAATAYFQECDVETADEWEAAHKQVQAGTLSCSDLPRVKAGAPRIEVVELAIEPRSNASAPGCDPSSLAA